MVNNNKGMSAALTLVITAVVLIVISLVVITIVSGGLGNFFKRTDMQSNESSVAAQCSTAVSYCNLQIMSGCSTQGTYNADSLKYNGVTCTAWQAQCGGIQAAC
ncbi:MAG: hypothetical protein K0B02_04855 [DPANN group archaeon]|nr:hypothetical protein [DPANN group archaeon]